LALIKKNLELQARLDELEYESCQLKSSLVSLRAQQDQTSTAAKAGAGAGGAGAVEAVEVPTSGGKQQRPQTINTIDSSTVGLSSGLAASIQRTKSLIIGEGSGEYPPSPGPMVKGVFLLAALAGATVDEFSEGMNILDTAEQQREYRELQESASVDQLDTKVKEVMIRASCCDTHIVL
jgi:hypothetical protein